MASDGGQAYPNFPAGVLGMSVRDEFAKAIVATERRPVPSEQAAEAQEVYRYAQLLTDEKLRRDQADRDKGKAG